MILKSLVHKYFSNRKFDAKKRVHKILTRNPNKSVEELCIMAFEAALFECSTTLRHKEKQAYNRGKMTISEKAKKLIKGNNSTAFRSDIEEQVFHIVRKDVNKKQVNLVFNAIPFVILEFLKRGFTVNWIGLVTFKVNKQSENYTKLLVNKIKVGAKTVSSSVSQSLKLKVKEHFGYENIDLDDIENPYSKMSKI